LVHVVVGASSPLSRYMRASLLAAALHPLFPMLLTAGLCMKLLAMVMVMGSGSALRLGVVRLWAERGPQSQQAARATTAQGGREQLVDGRAVVMATATHAWPPRSSGSRGGGAPTMTPHARRDPACHVWGARPVRTCALAPTQESHLPIHPSTPHGQVGRIHP